MTPHHFISNRSLRAVLRGLRRYMPTRAPLQVGQNFCWIPEDLCCDPVMDSRHSGTRIPTFPERRLDGC